MGGETNDPELLLGVFLTGYWSLAQGPIAPEVSAHLLQHTACSDCLGGELRER